MRWKVDMSEEKRTNPRVSVLIPLDRSDVSRVGPTLASLLAQTVLAAEVLLIARAPGEADWAELVQVQQSHRSLVLVEEHRSDLASAVRAGMSLALGDYATCILPGCQLHREALATMGAVLDGDPTAVVVAARCPHRDWPDQAAAFEAGSAPYVDRYETTRGVLLWRSSAVEGVASTSGAGAGEEGCRVELAEGATRTIAETLCACAEGCDRRGSGAMTVVTRIASCTPRGSCEDQPDEGAVPPSWAGDRPGAGCRAGGRRPKVLMVAPAIAPAGYGIGRHVAGLARALARRGCEVYLLAPDTTPRRRGLGEGVHVLPPGEQAPFRAPTRMAQVLQQQVPLLTTALEAQTAQRPFDLVHLHGWTGASLARAVCTLSALPLVVTLHCMEPSGLDEEPLDEALYMREVQTWVYEAAGRVICLSHLLAAQAHAAHGLAASKAEVIPPALDADDWTTQADLHAFRELFGAREDRLVAFAGHLLPSRGPQVLMEALPVTLTAVPEARVAIAGDGPLSAALEARARELGVDDRVTFTGYLSGRVLATLLRASAVHVVPGLVDGSGLAAAEAMVSEVPVIACEGGGAVELVAHEHTGVLVPPGDPAALAAAIVRMLYDREMARAISIQGRAQIHSRHLWRDVVSDVLRAYARVSPKFLALC
jgi:glycogen(starch) synthase